LSQIKRWFGNDKQNGIAVVLGDVPGGLVCRDFDDMEACGRWVNYYPERCPRSKPGGLGGTCIVEPTSSRFGPPVRRVGALFHSMMVNCAAAATATVNASQRSLLHLAEPPTG